MLSSVMRVVAMQFNMFIVNYVLCRIGFGLS